jgi:hypothetical protein
LKVAKKLWKSDSPPRGREGCKDCIKANALFALGGMIDSATQIQDRQILDQSGNTPEVVRFVDQRILDRRWSRFSALRELQDENGNFNFNEDGMVANWEHFDD